MFPVLKRFPKTRKFSLFALKQITLTSIRSNSLDAEKQTKNSNYKVLLLFILPTVTIHKVTHLCTVNNETMESGCRFADLDDRFIVLGVG